MTRESLVAAPRRTDLEIALNICGWYHHGESDRPLPDDPALLSTLLAHASPEAKAAALRGLLGERLASHEMMGVRWSRIIEHEYGSDPTINEEALVNLLAPEAR